MIWSVAGLLPVLISRTRLSQYLLPALPALAALAGLLLARGLTFAAAQRGAEVEADKQLQATPAQATPAPARLLLALLAALLLGLFANNNLSRWLAPDFTPQLREVLAALPPRARLPRLLVFNDYHAAARWYADRPTRLVTDSKRAQSLLTGSRAMKETHVVEHVAPGQLVRVQLRVTLPQNAAYMMVEDMLPGGLEPLNEKLNTSSRVGLHNQEPEYRWQQFGYNYKEVHRDRVTFFITEMDSGPHTFTYIARAQHRGIFTAMPTEVYAMYDLTVWGRSSSTPFVIE